ncbi:MAG TPA: hypothetical protein PKC24_00465 [Cyclobacteriaceae bacterium]|nr:hypothetical protein [Cyclobacteriaceae bacterium]
MNIIKISTYVLFVVAIGLGLFLANSIRTTIVERESIAEVESQIIEKLKLIREAQIVFQEVNKRYTSNWDSLIYFIENAEYPIVERIETIIPLAYGRDSINVQFDTIDFVPVKDRIFKKTMIIDAADNGTFGGFLVKEGDRVVKGVKAYRLTVGDKTTDHTFLQSGTISTLADIKPGEKINKNRFLITYWEYQFNPNIDLNRLAYVPGSKNNQKFEIFTAKVERGLFNIDVIEVKDPAPINPNRKESNEAKNRKPLRFGSRTDVSTAGNWE